MFPTSGGWTCPREDGRWGEDKYGLGMSFIPDCLPSRRGMGGNLRVKEWMWSNCCLFKVSLLFRRSIYRPPSGPLSLCNASASKWEVSLYIATYSPTPCTRLNYSSDNKRIFKGNPIIFPFHWIAIKADTPRHKRSPGTSPHNGRDGWVWQGKRNKSHFVWDTQWILVLHRKGMCRRGERKRNGE